MDKPPPCAASEALYAQAEAKREYLASVKGVQRNLKGMFGVGNAAQVSRPGPERFKALAEMVYGALKYTGTPGQGRMLHASYGTEASDPLHRKAFKFKNGKGVMAKGGGVLCEWYDAKHYPTSNGEKIERIVHVIR